MKGFKAIHINNQVSIARPFMAGMGMVELMDWAIIKRPAIYGRELNDGLKINSQAIYGRVGIGYDGLKINSPAIYGRELNDGLKINSQAIYGRELNDGLKINSQAIYGQDGMNE